MQAAVYFLSDEGSGLCDQPFDIESKPLLGIELASLDPFLLLLQDYLWNVSIACMVEVDEGRVHVEIS